MTDAGYPGEAPPPAAGDAGISAAKAMLLEVRDLRVDFRVREEGHPGVLRRRAVGTDDAGIAFDIAADRSVALVGESGSGKTVTAMSILRLLPDNAECRGQVLFQGQDLLQAPPARLRAVRGREIACVFQDPMSSLNPVLTVGDQICEPLQLHLGLSRRAAWVRAEELLGEVGMPQPRKRLRAFAHELSGGQQQRVMIAMALACEPRLLIADEPTTALDVTVQRQIIELLAQLKARHRMGLLFISHDLGLVGEIADEVVVMRHGQVREAGPVAQIFAAPQDAYTRALLACRPSLDESPRRLAVVEDFLAGRPVAQGAPAASSRRRAAPPAGLALETRPTYEGAPRAPVVLEARSLSKSYLLRDGLWRRSELKALQSVSFVLRRGQTLGVVGESGSGKSTLALALLRLHEPQSGPVSGEVLFDGQDWLAMTGAQQHAMRRRIQIVFQNPYASLNPRFSVGQILLEPMRIHRLGRDEAHREELARQLLAKVSLPAEAMGRYPHEFSGGQRQRIAIARCLSLQPEVLVLDEAVSALDVSVQAQVLNLLKDLQDELGLAYVFISHDLGVVRFMADEVLVMKEGRVVEQSSARRLMSSPREDYTRKLLAAIPRGHVGGLASPV